MKQIKSFPKINLGLKIYPKKVNETKHQIDSIFVLYKKTFDKIIIKKNNKLLIEYFDSNDNKISISDCLIEKSIIYLCSKYNKTFNKHIKIWKKIPLSSGLGAGSSNAAKIILFFAKVNKIKLDYFDIALNLGSDIPFFLSKYNQARVMGIGEKIIKIKKPKIKYQLKINSGKKSTKSIFKKIENNKKYTSIVDIENIILFLYKKTNQMPKHWNDFEKYIKFKFPNNKIKWFFSGAGNSIIIL